MSKDLDIATVLARSGNFDLNGNINRSVSLAIDNGVSAGSIASVKTSYTDSATGWFIGYNGIQTGSLPVINIGNDTNYLKWTGTAIDIKGKFQTTGTAGSYISNTLTIDGGSISADKAVWMQAPDISLNSDYLTISSATTEIFGGIKLSGNTLFNGAYNQIDRDTEVGGISTKNIRNVWIRNTLISASSSNGSIGDIWIQY